MKFSSAVPRFSAPESFRLSSLVFPATYRLFISEPNSRYFPFPCSEQKKNVATSIMGLELWIFFRLVTLTTELFGLIPSFVLIFFPTDFDSALIFAIKPT